jgi:hypothetical protein
LIEGEIRQSTLDRERYHLRATLKLAEHGPLDLRKLTPAFAGKLYDQRSGAVDTHRNGLSVAKAFGAWYVTKSWLRANPFAGSCRTWSGWPGGGCQPRHCSRTRRRASGRRTGHASRSPGSASSPGCHK